MHTLAMILFVVVAALAVAQLIPAVFFARLLQRGKLPRLPDEDCPKVAVILALRGNDPFLSNCLESLIVQDYPDFDIRIVIDRRNDPAWQIVEELIQSHPLGNVHVEALTKRLNTCGLKCSSLLQAIDGLDESYEVVAFMDADAMPHRSWLRDLVAPLLHEKIAVTSGQRWYMPQDGSLGAMIRYVWNAGNVVAMSTRSVWGGSFAIKNRVLHESGLLEQWRKSLAEDALIYDRIQAMGYSMAFVPSAIMVNREDCGVGTFFRWIQRQILLGRLYHFAWPLILAHGLTTTLVLLTSAALVPICAANGSLSCAVSLGGGLLGYGTLMSLSLVLMEWSVRHVIRQQNQPVQWFSFAAFVKSLLAIPHTQLVYTCDLSKAALMRRVEWRGVWYEIDRSRQVRLVEYVPFEITPRPAESAESV